MIKLHADRVEFYYDRFLIEADGNVQVTTSDGMTLSGDAFSMDLKLNRFLLAGHVHAQSPAGAQNGAALADFVDFDRIYFVPIIMQVPDDPPQPDRWTFIRGDFAHPLKGREMPGDTFYFPDTSKSKPFLVTTSAVIGADSFVRFGPGKADLGGGAGAYTPVPSFYVNFSTDPHLGANSLAGANFDATYNVAGNANAISALHFRYDTVNKTYLAFEQHVSSEKAYAVFSINPMTRPNKFWNLLTSYQPSDRLQIRSFTQFHTYQYGLTLPLESGQSTVLQVVQGLPQSFISGAYTFTNFNLLEPNGTNNHGGHFYITNHPSNVQITAQTFDHQIGHLPLFEHVNYGFGFQNDSYGLQSLGGVIYNTVWQHNIGATLYTPSYGLRNTAIPTKNYYVNFAFQKQLQWNQGLHYTDTTDSRVSLSKTFDTHFLSYAQYDVNNIGDMYGALQSRVYPSFVPVVGGIRYPGYASFTGNATLRTLSLGVTYTNGPNFTFSLLAQQHKDFPAPIPFLFPPPLTDVLGEPLPGNYLGLPPYDVSADVRMRVMTHMTIDLQRAYYFNFANRRWSPQLVIQVSP